jgi:hypothetical protein
MTFALSGFENSIAADKCVTAQRFELPILRRDVLDDAEYAEKLTGCTYRGSRTHRGGRYEAMHPRKFGSGRLLAGGASRGDGGGGMSPELAAEFPAKPDPVLPAESRCPGSGNPQPDLACRSAAWFAPPRHRHAPLDLLARCASRNIRKLLSTGPPQSYGDPPQQNLDLVPLQHD